MHTSSEPKASPSGIARKTQLVECAVDALVERGYAGTSIAEVARRAGVSKGVVSYHFPTKKDLLGEVVASLYRDAGERISIATVESESVIAELTAYICSNLDFVAENPRHVRAVMEVAANLRPDGHGVEDPLAVHLRELIERGQATGELVEMDANVVAVTIRASIDAAAARAACDATANPRAHAKHLSALVRRALQSQES